MKSVRIVNRSRRYTITVYGDGCSYRLLPGFQFVGAAQEISCEDPHDPRALVRINGSKVAYSLEGARTEAIVQDDPQGGLDLRCIGATAMPEATGDDETASGRRRTSPAQPQKVEEVAKYARAMNDPVWVTVLGGGIAGLTAAHELAERGFYVQVVEKAHSTPSEPSPNRQPNDDPGPSRSNARGARTRPSSEPARAAGLQTRRLSLGLHQPDVGGVARTQWVVPASAVREEQEQERSEGWKPAETKSVHGDIAWDPQTARQAPTGSREGLNDKDCFYVPFSQTEPLNFQTHFGLWWGSLTGSTSGSRALAAVQLVAVVYRYSGAQVPGEIEGIIGPHAAYARLKLLRQAIASAMAAVVGGSESVNPVLRCFQDADVLPAARIEVDLTADAINEQNVRWRDGYTGACIRAFESSELIAGEHGFRFFPGFYRHLRDTMKRTPLFDASSGDATEHSVHDHLHEVEWQTIADPTRQRPSSFARRNISSTGALVEQYQSLRRELGYRPSDLLRFSLRMLRYATSSSARREATYEDLSWYDFLTLRDLRGARTKVPVDLGAPSPEPERLHYGQRFEDTIRHSPRALVAMDAAVTDARSQGNVSLQLGMDQFDLHDATDSTLRAPTSDAWLVHWKAYLQRLGVRFFVGEVTSLALTESLCEPVIAFAAGDPPTDYVRAEELHTYKVKHYVVSALDLVNTERVCRDLAGEFGTDRTVAVPDNLDRLTHWVGPGMSQDDTETRDPEDINAMAATAADRLQTLTGIQIYFQQRTSFVDGHIYYAGSPWGLSAVSQVQYWRPFMGGRNYSGLLGNLSVDIGAWRAWEPSPAQKRWLPKRTFWEKAVASPNALSPREIAELVCEQITECARINQAEWASPAYFHIDDNIEFEWKPVQLVRWPAGIEPDRTATATATDNGGAPTGTWQKRPSKNRYPYLINVVGDWKHRPPGEPWAPNDPGVHTRTPGRGRRINQDGVIPVWSRAEGNSDFGYRVHGNSLVFCGAWLRTFTRMGTMESANESARHAVNAILDHLASTIKELHPEPVAPPRLVDTDAGSDQKINFIGPRHRRASEAINSPGRPPVRRGTPYGDYCDIWDPERFEFPDLVFAKLIDEKIMERFAREARQRDRGEGDDVYIPPRDPKAPDAPRPRPDYSGLDADGKPIAPPHIFDRLGVDRLPDLIEHDGEAVSALNLLDGLIGALREASGSDAEAAARSLDAWRIKLDHFVSKLHKKHVVT